MINHMLTNHGRVLTYAGISMVLALGITAGGWLYILNKIDTALQLPTTEQVYELKDGTTLSGMVRELHLEGLIESHLWLRIYARLTFNSGPIKTGEYLLREGMTQQELLQLVRAGKVIQRQFTIIEGWKLDRIRAEIAALDGL